MLEADIGWAELSLVGPCKYRTLVFATCGSQMPGVLFTFPVALRGFSYTCSITVILFPLYSGRYG